MQRKILFYTFAAVVFFFNVEASDMWVAKNIKNKNIKNMSLATVHPVSTSNPEAQRYFDQGLMQLFAFNHDMSFLEFEKSAQADPNLAMAYWGMALALGQNINQDITPINEKKAFAYSQKALSLLSYASPVEQDYIKALAVRYTNDPNRDLMALRYHYSDAMQKLAERYPEDLDAACLYAESILNLSPWKYWTWDGIPKERTMEAIQILQSILNRDPDHLGANHFYIHTWEESPTPERALLSAFRLTTLLPYSGHLLHMPCHIFILCGHYTQAINTSKRAIAADRLYLQEHGQEPGLDGPYLLHYLTHNLHVLTRAYMLAGDYENAIEAAQDLIQFITPHYRTNAHLAKKLIVPIEVNLYFEQWETLLNLPSPDTNDPFVRAYWHFSRSLAFLHLGNQEAYQKEREQMITFQRQIPPSDEIANNSTARLIDLATLLLDAEEKRGDSADRIATLRQAVEMQDRFDYDEPPPWYLPLRIELGQALLENQQYQEAEKTFLKGLQEYKRNGRLLMGLYYSLKAQNRDWDAFWVKRQTDRN